MSYLTTTVPTECDFCPTVGPVTAGLCPSCDAEELRIIALEEETDEDRKQRHIHEAILTGDTFDILQAFGDPGDGDIADYL